MNGARNLAAHIFMLPLFGIGFRRMRETTIHSRAASGRAISSFTTAFKVGTLS
jgi:hypothetical protein